MLGGGRGGGFFVAVRHVSGQFGHAHLSAHGVAERFKHSPGGAYREPDPLQMANDGGHGLWLAVAHELQPLPHDRAEQHGGAAAACQTAAAASTVNASIADTRTRRNCGPVLELLPLRLLLSTGLPLNSSCRAAKSPFVASKTRSSQYYEYEHRTSTYVRVHVRYVRSHGASDSTPIPFLRRRGRSRSSRRQNTINYATSTAMAPPAL